MKWTAFESRIKLQKSRNSLAEVSHTNGDLRGGGERLVQAIDMYRKFKCSTKIRNNKRGRKLIDQEFHTRQVLGKSHTQIWGNPTHRFGEIPHTDLGKSHTEIRAFSTEYQSQTKSTSLNSCLSKHASIHSTKLSKGLLK